MATIRLLIQTKKETFYPGNGKRKVQHVARIGALSASADTEIQAKAALDRLVTRAVEMENAIVVMYNLFDPSEVWIASGDAHGWGYRIVRPRAPGSHYSRESACLGGWTREECLDRMSDHWYACNAGLIVEGICALAGWGRVECKKCRTATGLRHNPKRCENPACGAAL